MGTGQLRLHARGAAPRNLDSWIDLMTGIRSMLLARVLWLPACGTVPPTQTTQSPLALEAEPNFYLMAAKQKPAIVASLRRAGIVVVDDLLESSHQLRVTLGVDKSFRDCGTLNNVIYAIRLHRSTLVEFKGRGWTGECQPNIFDEMSRELAQTVRTGMASSGSE
jgi:hypothetical protein